MAASLWLYPSETSAAMACPAPCAAGAVEVAPATSSRLMPSTKPLATLSFSATDNTYKKTYKHQIAYTPRVSGSGQAGIETPWINLSYAFLFSGKRYTQGENISQNRLDGYSDHSLSASRNLKIRDINTSLSIEVLNLLNKNYEIIKSFPMPGRSVRATLKITY